MQGDCESTRVQNSANECNDLQRVSIQHDLASFDIQSFGRTAIAKGEALRLKDAELEEARRVLEEEKVGSLMWCAAVAFPCQSANTFMQILSNGSNV